MRTRGSEGAPATPVSPERLSGGASGVRRSMTPRAAGTLGPSPVRERGGGLIQWASELGSAPDETLDVRLRRAILVISTLLVGGAGLLWGGIYFALGAGWIGLVPVAYSVLSAISLGAFARRGRYDTFRTVQIGLILCLPILLQVLVGGFAAGSAVMVWSILAPLGALMFAGVESGVGWFALFMAAAIVCGALDARLAAHTVPIPPGWRSVLFVMNLSGPLSVVYVMLRYLVRGQAQLRQRIAEQEKALEDAQQLGPYTLEGKLGAGGMGVVYRARHALLRRPTAVKMLPVGTVGEESLRRFEREVQLTATLSHPNIIAIHDYGRSTAGVFYYAMEFLDGIDLDTLVRRRGPLPPARVVHILEQVCSALDEAHHRGLIHRDIKPANIMICRLGRRPDVVKVLDFGLVKELEGAEVVTREDAISGTPSFIAPESVTSPSTVGPSADLYAVGAVAYWLLTGRTVFVGETALAIYMSHVNDEPERPSLHAKALPSALDRVILECLAKQPAGRPPSARSLRQALAGVECPEPWTEDTAHAWWDEFDRSPERDVEPITGTEQTLQVDARTRGKKDAPALATTEP